MASAVTALEFTHTFNYHYVSDDECENQDQHEEPRQSQNKNKNKNNQHLNLTTTNHQQRQETQTFHYDQLKDDQVRDFVFLVSSNIAEHEEAHLFQSVQKSIDDSTDQILFDSLQQRIENETRQWDAPSGRVHLLDKNPIPNQQIDPEEAKEEQEWELYRHQHDIITTEQSPPLHSTTPSATTILEEDYLGNEQKIVTKILPKFMEHDDERLFSKQSLESHVAIAMQGKLDHRSSIDIQDSMGESNSVVLEARGSEQFISAVERSITDIILEKQMRIKHLLKTMTYNKMKKKRKRGGDRLKKPTKKLTPAAKLKTNVDAYGHFCRKYHILKQIEFKGTGIHEQKVNKYLWRQHKAEISDFCDSNCHCSFKLDVLSKNVVRDYKKDQQQADPNWAQEISNNNTGFTTSFAGKFIRRLREEFPFETPEQIYRRLVRMFEEHQKQIQYGQKCSPACACGEAWELVFLKGRVGEKGVPTPAAKKARKKAPMESPRPTKTIYRPSQSPTSPQIYQTSTKKRKINFIPRAPLLTTGPTQQSLISSLTPRSEGNNSVPLNLNSELLSPIESEKSFDVEFDASRQLGFFCTNKFREATIDGHGRNGYCVIESVNRIGVSNDRRIWPGTIIIAAKNNASGMFTKVNCFEPVRGRFLSAQKQKMTLVLELSNTQVMARHKRAEETDWTSLNEWTVDGNNRYGVGWSGGASFVGKPRPYISLAQDQHSRNIYDRSTANEKIPYKTSTTNVSATETAREQLKFKPLWASPTPIDQPATGAPQARAHIPDSKVISSKSILRSPKLGKSGYFEKEKRSKDSGKSTGVADLLNMGKRSKPIRVKFRDKLAEVKMYNVNSKSVQLSDETTETGKEIKLTSLKVHKKSQTVGEELMSSIRRRNPKLVYEILMKGYNLANDKKILRVVKSKRESIKAELVRARSAHDRDRSERNKSAMREVEKATEEMRLIETLLKIFKLGNNLVRMCQELKHWERIRVDVQAIRNISMRGYSRGQNGHIILTLWRKKRMLEPKIYVPISSDTSYLKVHQQGSHELNYNRWFQVSEKGERIGREDDEVVFKLEYEDKRSGTKRFLGEVTKPLADFTKKNGVSISIDFKPTEILESATMNLVCRSDKPRDLLEGQMSLCHQNFGQMMNDLKGFERDRIREKFGVPYFGFNLKSCHHPYLTPLHGAIYLHDPNLIQALLERGADPSAKSKLGTPKALAESLLEGLDSKIERGALDENERKVKDRLTEIGKKLRDWQRNVASERENGMDTAEDNANTHSRRPTSKAGYTNSEPNERQRNEKSMMGRTKPSRIHGEGAETSFFRSDHLPSQHGHSFSVTATMGFNQLHNQRREDHRRRDDHFFRQQTGANEDQSRAGYLEERGFQGHREKVKVLPKVSRSWFGNDKRECKHFEKGECLYGLKCHHLHISPKFGSIVDESSRIKELEPVVDDKNIFVLTQKDDQGNLLYTVAIFDPKSRVYIKAEGGYTEGERDGTFWYQKERDAVQAAIRALTVYRHQNKFHVAQSREAIENDVSIRSKKSNSHSHNEREAATEHRKTAAGDSLFSLLKSSDLGMIYKKITDSELYPQNWKLQEEPSMGKYYYAALTVKVEGIFSKTERFESSVHGDEAKKAKGKWYHHGTKAAKASAFVKFMEKCEEAGLIFEMDRQQVNLSGEPLPFGENVG